MHGESLKHYLVAVTVPNLEVAARAAGIQLQQSNQELSEEDKSKLCAYFLSEFQRIGTEKQLQPYGERCLCWRPTVADFVLQICSYQIPQACCIEMEEFTAARGLLTPTFKNARPKIREYFKSRITELYAAEDEKNERLRIKQMLNETLGEQADGGGFAQRGGDSLSAVRLVEKIKREFQVSIPVNVFLQEQDSIHTHRINLSRRSYATCAFTLFSLSQMLRR